MVVSDRGLVAGVSRGELVSVEEREGSVMERERGFGGLGKK